MLEYCPIKFIHISISECQPFTIDNLLLESPLPIDVLPPPELAMHNHPNYVQAARRRSTDRFKTLITIGEEIFNGNTDTES